MTPAPSYLRNTESVVRAFGYWPSFHDASVVAFRYDRGGQGAVEFTLHGWEMTPEVDERGSYKLTKHHLVRFAFQDISDADLDRFSAASNILFGLGLSTAEEFQSAGKFSVDLNSAMGGDLCGSFCARTGEVLEVLSCDPDGQGADPCAPPNGGHHAG
jgi:hypothetical protein